MNDPLRPEIAVAYPEQLVRSVFDRNDLVVERVDYGSWCGRTSYTSFQDIVVAKRT